jgi:ADP-ribose pyrophosphatase YjhB (NUDIX family)
MKKLALFLLAIVVLAVRITADAQDANAASKPDVATVIFESTISQIQRDGYPLDSGSPYRLWFAFSFPGGRVDDPAIGDGIDSHCLLRETKEELASTF